MTTTAILLSLLAAFAVPAEASSPEGVRVCTVADPDPPPYYAIDLITTKRVPGSRLATGVANVTFKSSPFGVALSPTGEYIYTLSIAIDNLAPAQSGAYVVWVTTPDLSQVERIGTWDNTHRIQGEASWNKFLVVVSLEENPDDVERWSGPIVLRGMSRSGMMHTMAGHGPFQTEPCAVYGYQ